MKPKWVVLLLTIAVGCSKDSSAPLPATSEREPGSASAGSALERRDAVGAEGTRDAGAPSGPLADAFASWAQFSRQDDVPLCFFARYADWVNAPFLKDVKDAVSLKARRELHFGVYAPGCAAPDCIRRATLQCWADVEGNSITVHTRYSGERNGSKKCIKDCEPTTAACNTPALEAGTYAVTYGDLKQTIRIPGTLRPACIQISE